MMVRIPHEILEEYRMTFQKMINIAWECLTDSSRRFTYLTKLGFYNKLSDEEWIKEKFRRQFHREVDLDNPQTFNEKLQWLKLYDRNPLYTTLVDKYAVREYVAERIGEEFLIPLVGGPWETFDEIDFDILPNQFVLKATHDSGGVVICKDKNHFNVNKARKKINWALRSNYYYRGREWPYKNVKPRIIAEKYIVDKSEEDLLDYKLMCFDSKVKTSFVCSERYSKEGLKVTFFDSDWKRMPFERHYPASKVEIKKPDLYEKMVEIAEKLSKDIKFARIDLYEANGKIYFGEITFFPGSGFEEFNPIEWDKIMGDWIDLESL